MEASDEESESAMEDRIDEKKQGRAIDKDAA